MDREGDQYTRAGQHEYLRIKTKRILQSPSQVVPHCYTAAPGNICAALPLSEQLGPSFCPQLALSNLSEIRTRRSNATHGEIAITVPTTTKDTRKALSQRGQGLSLLGGLKPYGDITPIQGKGNRIQRHEKDLPQGGLYPAIKGVVPAILQDAGAIY